MIIILLQPCRVVICLQALHARCTYTILLYYIRYPGTYKRTTISCSRSTLIIIHIIIMLLLLSQCYCYCAAVATHNAYCSHIQQYIGNMVMILYRRTYPLQQYHERMLWVYSYRVRRL